MSYMNHITVNRPLVFAGADRGRRRLMLPKMDRPKAAAQAAWRENNENKYGYNIRQCKYTPNKESSPWAVLTGMVTMVTIRQAE